MDKPAIAIVIQKRFHRACHMINIHRTRQNDDIRRVHRLCQRSQFFIVRAALLVFQNTLHAAHTVFMKIPGEEKLRYVSPRSSPPVPSRYDKWSRYGSAR